MTASGQTRRFRDVRSMSGLPQIADISGPGRHFAFAPNTDMRHGAVKFGREFILATPLCARHPCISTRFPLAGRARVHSEDWPRAVPDAVGAIATSSLLLPRDARRVHRTRRQCAMPIGNQAARAMPFAPMTRLRYNDRQRNEHGPLPIASCKYLDRPD